MILVTVLALAGPFFLTGPNGRPLMSVSSLGLGDIPYKIKSFFRNLNATSSQTSNTDTSDKPGTSPDGLSLVAGDQVFYKWKDEHGVWQFTTEPPPATATAYEPVITNPNANVIQSLGKDKIDSTLGRNQTSGLTASTLKDNQSKTAELSEQLEALGYDSANPMEQIPKILEQTQQIKTTMESRQTALDQL